jgi:hypothetical protein
VQMPTQVGRRVYPARSSSSRIPSCAGTTPFGRLCRSTS